MVIQSKSIIQTGGESMKKVILIMSLLILASSCGKKENTAAVSEATGISPIDVTIVSLSLDSLEGVYDLISTDAEDCGASIQIIKRCEGVQVRNNNLRNESYCNVNKGEIKTGDNRSSTTVSLESNLLKSVVLIFDERSTPPGKVKQVLTSSLSMDENGNLLKIAESQAGKSKCLYQKR